MKKRSLLAIPAFVLLASCSPTPKNEDNMQAKVDAFVEVELTSEISHLSAKEKEMLPYLFEAAQIIDDIFWLQAYGNKDELFSKIEDESTLAFTKINYGPWERLKDNTPFVDGYEAKPLGAGFYPLDMTKEEFEAFKDDAKTSLYSLIRRDEQGNLVSIPYSEAYKE